jgi:enamine deaminase RidA (YjgF/YER057c/UK114 family)
MNYLLKTYNDLGVFAEISVFEPRGKVAEFQVMIHVIPQITNFNQQLQSLYIALQKLLTEEILHNTMSVSARCFLSDAVNQHEQVSNLISSLLDCDICCVKQPPLDGTKLALWLQLKTKSIKRNNGLNYHEHNGYRHYHTTVSPENNNTKENTYQQTLNLLEAYEEQLKTCACTIENDCIRTWFFIRDVEANYKDFVEARKENFLLNGLTSDTHYIASTGIEGSTSNLHENVLMNAYTIHGLEKGQKQFLYAKDYLNPTYEYGVTFERGVSLDFGDRRTVYISGTASIDNKGKILFPGDLEGQVQRTWANTEALLKEGDCTFDDLMQIIVYVRDLSDYQCVKKMFQQKFSGIPQIIVLAAVCRPGWLVEMECIASKVIYNGNYRDL